MPVNQHGAPAGLMFVARPNDRMPLCWDQLCLQADGSELVYEPSCAFLQLFLVLVISRDTRKPEKRIIILKIVVAHGHKLIGFRNLPTISAVIARDRDTRWTQWREQPPPATTRCVCHCRRNFR